jgi:hypothetical protein
MEEQSIKVMKDTWVGRFQLYFDQSQWLEYHGLDLWPNPALKVVKRGRTQKKRFWWLYVQTRHTTYPEKIAVECFAIEWLQRNRNCIWVFNPRDDGLVLGDVVYVTVGPILLLPLPYFVQPGSSNSKS